MPPHRINLNSNSNFGMQGNKMVLFTTTDLDFWGSTFVFISRHQLLLKSVGINTKNVTDLTQFIYFFHLKWHSINYLLCRNNDNCSGYYRIIRKK